MSHFSTLAKSLALAASVAAGLASVPAQAAIGLIDRVPAATLLLPYFEVDLADPNGEQTRFSVINTEAAPQLAHVTLWSDTGVPTFSFDVYLGGRDTTEVDLRLLFSGVVPQTSPSTFTAGPYSQSHTAVTGCPLAPTALYAGMPAPGLLPAAQIDHLRAAHTGKASAAFGGMCSAANHGDSIARGYVTIDAANNCSAAFPTDAGYFVAGGLGIASNHNVLVGQYTQIDRNDALSTASPLVSVEASATDSRTSAGSDRTFYGGYVNFTGADNREALNNVWDARNLDVGFFEAGTQAVGWRDPVFAHNAFACGALPADFPRGQASIGAFDEREQVKVLNTDVVYPNPQPPPVRPFPLMTQRVDVSDFSPFPAGWLFINLNEPLAGSPNGSVQSYVAVRHRFRGVFGALLPAQALGSDNNILLGN